MRTSGKLLKNNCYVDPDRFAKQNHSAAANMFCRSPSVVINSIATKGIETMRLVCFALFLTSALAQVGGTGSIEGTVTDPSGAVVAGATVTATNVATGAETDRKTTDAGFFVLPLLPAGEYTVTVKAAGFQTLTQAHVVVDALADRGGESQVADRRGHPVDHGGGRADRPEDGRCRAGLLDQNNGLRCPSAGDERELPGIPRRSPAWPSASTITARRRPAHPPVLSTAARPIRTRSTSKVCR